MERSINMSGPLITLSDPNASFDNVFTKDERQVEELGALLQKLVRERNQFAVEIKGLQDAVEKIWSKTQMYDSMLVNFEDILNGLNERIQTLENNTKGLK
jgi:peptidoglycan hydrolase CwlO-like protein